jgi:hypothetical protein
VVGDDYLADATGIAKMWGGHAREWGRSGWVEEQILEARLEVLRARIFWMVWDMKKKGVLGVGLHFFLLWWLVWVDKACFERRGECLVYTMYHTVDEAGEGPRGWNEWEGRYRYRFNGFL